MEVRQIEGTEVPRKAGDISHRIHDVMRPLAGNDADSR